MAFQNNLMERLHLSKKYVGGLTLYNIDWFYDDIVELTNLIENGGSGGGGLTPEQEAKLNSIITNGDGNSFYANDGTYKPIQVPDLSDYLPLAAGSSNALTGDLYAPSIYSTAQASGSISFYSLGQFLKVNTDTLSPTLLGNNKIKVMASLVNNGNGNFNIGGTGSLEEFYNGFFRHIHTNTLQCAYSDAPKHILVNSDLKLYTDIKLVSDSELVLNAPNSIKLDSPIIVLADGAKITGASTSDSTNHEIFGINSYTDSDGTYDQLEVGSQEALYNVNIVYDAARTQGHATADLYNEDGSYRSKEIFAYVSDIVPNKLSAEGTATVTIPEQSIVLSVNYNRLMLFESDYINNNGLVTITNTDIRGTIEPTDKIEVTYLT